MQEIERLVLNNFAQCRLILASWLDLYLKREFSEISVENNCWIPWAKAFNSSILTQQKLSALMVRDSERWKKFSDNKDNSLQL